MVVASWRGSRQRGGGGVGGGSRVATGASLAEWRQHGIIGGSTAAGSAAAAAVAAAASRQQQGGGGGDTNNNQLKVATATATEMATMTATRMTMEMKAMATERAVARVQRLRGRHEGARAPTEAEVVAAAQRQGKRQRGRSGGDTVMVFLW